MSESRKTTALIILDGWGHREPSDDNAITNANTPVWDRLWAERPHTLLNTSGLAVGLPEGQMGNSEVGHMNIGAGRVVYQSLTRISKDVDENRLAQNPVLAGAIDGAIDAGGAVHVLGLLSPGGVHSHESHLLAACKMAAEKGARRVYLHAFLDGRDTPPRSAKASIEAADARLKELGVGHVASIIGRYYAMDRDTNWDRIEKAYRLLTEGTADYQAATALEGLEAAYERDENDEFVSATAIHHQGQAPVTVADNDAVLFMNFRADRARELTYPFTDRDFAGFERRVMPRLSGFVMLTEYAGDIDTPCAYPPESLHNGLGEYVSAQGKTQLRIAETEKYAHVTFFFNGGREQPFAGEDRVLVPSPKVATYDLKPEMSAEEVTDKLVERIEQGLYDLVICNYANPDMVGHTGNMAAAIKAAETLDACLERVLAALEKNGGQCLITADHGNCEQMKDASTGQAHTAHTTFPVPLVYAGPRNLTLEDGGRLCDLAPSLLALMGLGQPREMDGRSLIATDRG
ncbi:MAG: 2,3-bisphosphoglycerate-independent phosphoglycerate mutase [Oleiphilaceae bacterium]|nr:2,3-bisphosphoglycerate-independent phosphoglycerate mutase [Oleiphilaceae bacterium]